MENIVTFGIAYMTFLESFQALPFGTCDGLNGTSCCIGYRWDLTHEKCIACAKGHMGPYCDVKCPFPYYGSVCQERCNCIDKNCDPVNGCIPSISSTDYRTSPSDVQHNPTMAESHISEDYSVDKTYDETTCKTLNQESKRTNSITFALTGLLIVFFIIVFIYFYTRLFEKRVIDTRKVHCIDSSL